MRQNVIVRLFLFKSYLPSKAVCFPIRGWESQALLIPFSSVVFFKSSIANPKQPIQKPRTPKVSLLNDPFQAKFFVWWCDPLGQITNFSSFDSDIRMCWIRGAGTDPCKLWKQLTNKHSGATTQAAHRTDFTFLRIHWAIVRREHTLPAFLLYVSSLDHELMYPRFRKQNHWDELWVADSNEHHRRSSYFMQVLPLLSSWRKFGQWSRVGSTSRCYRVLWMLWFCDMTDEQTAAREAGDADSDSLPTSVQHFDEATDPVPLALNRWGGVHDRRTENLESWLQIWIVDRHITLHSKEHWKAKNQGFRFC